MLHVRRAAPPLSLGPVLTQLADRLAGADPGLIRLVLALRGTISVVLVTCAALLAARLLDVSPVDFASGITFSVMGPFLAREPTAAQRRRTLLVLCLPAAAAVGITALLHGYGPLGDSLFLVLVFVCFLLHPRSPRAIGLGLVAVVQAYVGLFLELPPATLPLQWVSIAAALPLVALACFVIVPMRPAATLRRTVHSVQWRAARALRSAAQSGAGRFQRDLLRLNEAAVAADDQLALLSPDGRDAVRAGLIDLELATARLIVAVRAEPHGPRHALRMMLHERRLRLGRRYVMRPTDFAPGSLRASLLELGHAAHRLGLAAGQVRPAPLTLSAAPPPGPLAWRLATRVTLAAALAMAAGMALSPQRWFWAVITVYVVFLNARSRGDTIYKGVQRLAGTLLGIASGLALALAIGSDPALDATALLLSVFGMYYWFLVSYTAGIFCVTVLLGLLYGLLGAPLETVLVLRFEETAIGAVAAMLVAAFVLPTRTRDQVRSSGRAVLTALADALRAAREGASPIEAMRKVDRQVADLRLALAPLTAGRTLLRRTPVERPIPALLDCVHWTRVLAATAAPPDPAYTAHLEDRLRRAAAGEPSRVHDVPPPALRQLGDAMDRLEAEIQLGTLRGFSVDA